MIKFGENVKLYRKASKITQSNFALLLNDKLASLGVDINYNNKSISMWENGERVPDNAIVWVAISELLNISIDQLLKGDIKTVEIVGNNICPKFNSYMDSINYAYSKQFIASNTNVSFKTNDIFNIFGNIDCYDNDNGVAHSMITVLSSIDSSCELDKYNILESDSTYRYIRSLHSKRFIKEKDFVSNLKIDNINQCPFVFSKNISDFWGKYLESYNIFVSYDCDIMYDEDNQHILTVVDCQLQVDKDTIIATLATVYNETLAMNQMEESYDITNSIGYDINDLLAKSMLANSKTILGMKYAKDKWSKKK